MRCTITLVNIIFFLLPETIFIFVPSSLSMVISLTSSLPFAFSIFFGPHYCSIFILLSCSHNHSSKLHWFGAWVLNIVRRNCGKGLWRWIYQGTKLLYIKKKRKNNVTFLNLVLETIFIYMWKLLKIIEEASKSIKTFKWRCFTLPIIGAFF